MAKRRKRSPRVRRKRKPRVFLMSFDELVQAGGPEALARQAAKEAAEQAAREERQMWLAWLEGFEGEDANDWLVQSYIRDLRRKLGLGRPPEVIRAQTRERVRRFRARRAAAKGR